MLSPDDEDRPCPCGRGHTIAEHPYDPDLTMCMEEECHLPATWRSEDGYPFCNRHAYAIYCAECELENLTAHTYSQWVIHGKPHGPIGGPDWDQILTEALDNFWGPVEQGQYDDDPNPYHGDYSEA